ncbi:signal peptidase I [Haloprofundus sp. MHR1]|uniref:signal peptidase I n=1 Tax=Haloprofundus sp. MHR1 TaxID=2572921 RepID=UPI001C2C493E|nr:signal peptidase I [Haloprofundus sp. MHR1]
MNLLDGRSRKVLNVLAALLLVGAVAPFVVYAVPQVVGADQSYVVLSASMSPDIQPGDAVVVGSVAPERIAEGDVITFHRSETSDTPVTHRVVDVERNGAERRFVTKGDANEDVDPAPVAADAVIGRVVLTLPYVGYVSTFADTPVGFVALVLVPFGFLATTELRGFLHARRGDHAETRAPEDKVTSERTGVDAASAASSDDDSPTDATEPTPMNVSDTETTPADRPDPSDRLDSSDRPDSSDSGITLTRADLTLSPVLLAVLGVYAGYVGVTGEDPLSVTVAAGALTAALLLLLARRFGLGDASSSSEGGGNSGDSGDSGDSTGAGELSLAGSSERPTGTDSTVALARVRLSSGVADLPRIEVSERHELSAIAATVGRPLVADEHDGTLLVVDGDVLYAHAVADAEPDSSLHAVYAGVDAPTDDAAAEVTR